MILLSCSNEASGLGCSDILIEAQESRTSVIIELKYAESGIMRKLPIRYSCSLWRSCRNVELTYVKRGNRWRKRSDENAYLYILQEGKRRWRV